MRVRELIEILAAMDPDADVRIMSQPNYPFEHVLAGVAVRSDFSDPDADATPRGASRDVFLLEGAQLGYGCRAAWRAPRR
jgi:hypothetical protein